MDAPPTVVPPSSDMLASLRVAASPANGKGATVANAISDYMHALSSSLVREGVRETLCDTKC